MNNQFGEIINMIQETRNLAIKSVNAKLINLYWQIGAYISGRLENESWGKKTVSDLADFIEKNYPDVKGFNRRGLYRMKQFYETYQLLLHSTTAENNTSIFKITEESPSDISKSLLAKLSWTHHLTLISRTKTTEELYFYLRLCVQENYQVKELERQINSSLFERIMLGKEELQHNIKISEYPAFPLETFQDKYVFEFLNLPEPHTERDLQKGLIVQMKKFILELGRDFLFIDQEYKVQVGNSDFFIDLLFYHRGLQCLIAFELKVDKFKPEHLGQLNFYLEALDREVRKANENPSIGILLCKDKDNEVVEYALNRSLSPTLVAEYQTQLPDKQLLQKKLHQLFSTHLALEMEDEE